MNEPKKRGRPSNAEREAKLLAATGPTHNGDTEHWPEPSPEPTQAPGAALLRAPAEAIAQAQELADRIYAGQSNALKPEVRRARILVALQERGLPFDIKWPDEVEPEQAKPAPPKPTDAPQSADDRAKAQAYAMKVWGGQTPTLGRAERVYRVRKAVEGQGLSMDGVELPRA